MSGGRTTIPAWEVPMLRAVMDGKFPAARDEALRAYIAERERRRRHAAVRDRKDAKRRTLVGAHVPREEAELVAWVANREDMSVTAFVRLAVKQALERSDSLREVAGRL